jgi:GNAT superfamily N-acetyltransferase
MRFTSRPYQSVNDLYATGELLRRAYRTCKCLNAWSFAQFDIWAQRRIADSETFGETAWKQYFRIWQDEHGKVIGAAFAHDRHHWRRNPDPHTLILDFDHPHLIDEMLDWAESGAKPEVAVKGKHLVLNNILERRGYVRSDDSMVYREKPLAETPFEPVNLPDGYHIEVLKHGIWPAYFVAVNAVFKMMDNIDSFRSIQQAPSNVPELHLNILSEQGEIAAFCSVWWDRQNNVAELEPVGTVPRFQKKGLGAALLAHACNRLREMGCPLVTVESWSESVGANKLYEACGLQEVDRVYNWKKM